VRVRIAAAIDAATAAPPDPGRPDERCARRDNQGISLKRMPLDD
jgi:hypothetical protein